MQTSDVQTPANAQAMAKLRVMLEDLIAENRGQEAIDMVLEMLAFLQHENTSLSLQLKKQLKARFGQSSEKLSGKQLELFLDVLGLDTEEDAEADAKEVDKTGDAEVDAHFENKDKERRSKKRHGRRPLPKSLPREEITIPVGKDHRECAICGANKKCIGHAKSEVLEWTPGQFKVLVYAREKVACKPCQGEVAVALPADKIIEGGLPGPGLLTEIVLKKYRYAQLLWRQAHYFSTMGVDLAPSTMSGWVKAVGRLTEPIYRELVRRLLLARCINTDDSHLRVLEKDHPKGIRRGSMWVYIGDRTNVVFDYTPTRSSDGPRRILDGYAGKVQADAYSGYDFLFGGEDAQAIEVGCAMHARRYFVEALEAGHLEAAIPIKWFRHIYKIEEYAKDIDADAKTRRAIRQKKTKPIMVTLGKWIAKNAERSTKGSPLAKAMGYAINQWDALCEFLEDGALEIDNGLSERVIRTIAIGKNYMFAGSDDAARHAAIIYSLIASCELAGADCGAYLRDVMTKIASGWPQSKIGELVPAEWARLHAAAVAHAA